MTTDKIEGGLKPCPFCGGTHVYYITTQGAKWGSAVCSECGVIGPEVRTGYDQSENAPWHVEALEAWNTRTGADKERREAFRMGWTSRDVLAVFGPRFGDTDFGKQTKDEQCETYLKSQEGK